MDNLYSVKDTCRMLGIGKTKFYELLDDERLSAIKIGRSTRIPGEVIDRFVKESPLAGRGNSKRGSKKFSKTDSKMDPEGGASGDQ